MIPPGRRPQRVALFVTCLVDLFRPSVGFAAVKLLEEAGCTVEVPALQVCCGQPAYNSGDRETTRGIARQVISAFEGYDAVVAPSGSCGGMLAHHYPGLFDDDPAMRARAEGLASRSHELMSFLVDVLGVERVAARYDGAVTYHDSCSGLRELDVYKQPRALLAKMPGVTINEMVESTTCCGFGGTFSVKYGELSTRMADNKCRHITDTHAGAIVGGDLGCLLNIEGRLRRNGDHTTRVLHVAEVLSGIDTDEMK